MGLFIGILGVLLVLLLVFTMAIAEWADKDIGDLLGAIFKRKRTETKKVTASLLQSETMTEIPSLQAQPESEKSLTKKMVKKTVKKAAKKTGKKAAGQTSGAHPSVKKVVVKLTPPKTTKTTKQSQKGKTK